MAYSKYTTNFLVRWQGEPKDSKDFEALLGAHSYWNKNKNLKNLGYVARLYLCLPFPFILTLYPDDARMEMEKQHDEAALLCMVS